MEFHDFHIGLRTTKTVIAVLVCSLFYYFVMNDTPVLVSMAAIFALRQDMKNTVVFSRVRVFGVLIGDVVSLLFILAFRINSSEDWRLILIVPFAVLLTIVLCNAFGLSQGIVAACATLLIIFYNIPPEDKAIYAFTRLFDTVFGVVVATIINAILPNHLAQKKRHESIMSLLLSINSVISIVPIPIVKLVVDKHQLPFVWH